MAKIVCLRDAITFILAMAIVIQLVSVSFLFFCFIPVNLVKPWFSCRVYFILELNVLSVESFYNNMSKIIFRKEKKINSIFAFVRKHILCCQIELRGRNKPSFFFFMKKTVV